MASHKDSIYSRLANEIALEQYGYDLLREKVNNELKQRSAERKQEISSELLKAERELK